ncbi:ATP-binding response regulator [Desulfospira joergensenii]|uniref:ATP-binding response regulator n=1 Tax=Desulfospira joergensenii TaxID=53329 RepID=UPI0003B4457E|nr:ATP-binding protein [Desulfospira joergensenii]
MERVIELINYAEEAIPDLEQSRFYRELEFKSIETAGELAFPESRRDPDVVVVFIRKEKQDCLERIEWITKTDIDKEIIAAVPEDMLDTGVKTLQYGASDFFTLPAKARTFDFYINRALERNYLHKHICFNDTCYQSRFARSEKNYEQLFNAVPCFIYVRDRDYQITDCNKKFKEYFGDHQGEYCFGILKNRDEPCTKCSLEKTFRDGTSHASEMEIISSDGVKHTVLCWTTPLRDSRGKIKNAMVMLTDITEVRRLEDHLTSLGFMIGSISHGIKGLLTSLDGGMYLMERGFEANSREKIREGFDQSRQMTARIKKLVLDILYYTKTRKMAWQQVSVGRFLEDTLKIVSGSARKNNIRIDHKLEVLTRDDIFEIDEESLQSAMVNIIENGIEACIDQGGEKQHWISFHARVDKEKALFTIQDNGLGMGDATLKNIFTIFFSSKGNKGTGLGLYIANKVVQQHRGEIKVKSTQDKGTKFLIKIPRQVPRTARNPRGMVCSN